MSVYWLSRVWEDSPHDKMVLLCELALADMADEDGVCWPSAAYLARKIRTTIHKDTKEHNTRHVYRLLKVLKETGEIYAKGKSGSVNKYVMVLGRKEEELAEVLVRRFKLDPEVAKYEASNVAMLQHRTPDKLSGVSSGTGGYDTAMSYDPSLNTYIIGDSEIDRKDPAYVELQNAVVMVCKRLNILMLSKKDKQQIDDMFLAKLEPKKIRLFYGKDNWWFQKYWKGRRGQFPTLSDIKETYGQAQHDVEAGDLPDFGLMKAWNEVAAWVEGSMQFSEFSESKTAEVVREIGEADLRKMGPQSQGRYKKQFERIWNNK